MAIDPHSATEAAQRTPARGPLALALLLATVAFGCASQDGSARSQTQPAASQPAAATQPAPVYDATRPRPVPPRDVFERWALERGADFELVDRLMDPRTQVPAFDRPPLASRPADARISADVATLDDTDPFRAREPLPPMDVTLRVGIARSTYRTREPPEVLSAAQPFIDLVQREVNMRGAAVLHDGAPEAYYGLLDGQVQMEIGHVFDYLLVQSWFADVRDNGVILLSWASPAHPRTTALDRDLPGVPGTSIELIVAADARYKTPADLRGARLALAANYVDAPGAFLTRLLQDLNHPLDQPFFGSVALRRYPKDAVIDVLKGKADVACVDQGTVGTLARFYGLEQRIRTLAVSPRYNVDVLYTSQNNVATHRTQIELAQRQLTTLDKDPEGQEVLFFYDVSGWHNYRAGEMDVAREHFADFVTFLEHTPVDLKPLLDPAAPVDRRTYDRYGDE